MYERTENFKRDGGGWLSMDGVVRLGRVERVCLDDG
jgi:hypothetical protein